MLRHLPNLITMARMLLVVPVAWSIRERHYGFALLLATIAGSTDALDGYLAKRFGWRSWVGGILDPIADKLLLITCFIVLGLIDQHPIWLTGLVIGRDVVIVLGAIAYHRLVGPIEAQPTLISKFTTCVQILYVLVQLLRLTQWVEVSSAWISVLIMLVAIATLASGIDYVVRWSLKTRRARAALGGKNTHGD